MSNETIVEELERISSKLVVCAMESDDELACEIALEIEEDINNLIDEIKGK